MIRIYAILVSLSLTAGSVHAKPDMRGAHRGDPMLNEIQKIGGEPATIEKI